MRQPFPDQCSRRVRLRCARRRVAACWTGNPFLSPSDRSLCCIHRLSRWPRAGGGTRRSRRRSSTRAYFSSALRRAPACAAVRASALLMMPAFDLLRESKHVLPSPVTHAQGIAEYSEPICATTTCGALRGEDFSIPAGDSTRAVAAMPSDSARVAASESTWRHPSIRSAHSVARVSVTEVRQDPNPIPSRPRGHRPSSRSEPLARRKLGAAAAPPPQFSGRGPGDGAIRNAARVRGVQDDTSGAYAHTTRGPRSCSCPSGSAARPLGGRLGVTRDLRRPSIVPGRIGLLAVIALVVWETLALDSTKGRSPSCCRSGEPAPRFSSACRSRRTEYRDRSSGARWSQRSTTCSSTSARAASRACGGLRLLDRFLQQLRSGHGRAASRRGAYFLSIPGRSPRCHSRDGTLVRVLARRFLAANTTSLAFSARIWARRSYQPPVCSAPVFACRLLHSQNAGGVPFHTRPDAAKRAASDTIHTQSRRAGEPPPQDAHAAIESPATVAPATPTRRH